jgi:hypothetical protein
MSNINLLTKHPANLPPHAVEAVLSEVQRFPHQQDRGRPRNHNHFITEGKMLLPQVHIMRFYVLKAVKITTAIL